ncbi:MAG: lytic transglycosylase [Desulfobulbus propionicus]|nr:MAG: lytic transglycosylase [Desulfobulbus propionicus]
MLHSKQRGYGFLTAVFFLILFLQGSQKGFAGEQSFQQWLNDFYTTAAEQGISRSTYDRAFAQVHYPDPRVLAKAHYQPEFKSTIWNYLDARVNPRSIQTGHNMHQLHRQTLQSVEKKFGVRSEVILAIWSMETSYGRVLKKKSRLHYIPQALATLAYADKKRAKYARTQLVAALKIVQAGDVGLAGLTGSWAGAMGHTQFIPTSYLAYGVDMNGDGRRDIWNTVSDALATAANLLAENGWQTGKTWGYEVLAPANGILYKGQTRTLKQWQQMGFVRTAHRLFPRPDDRAELRFPAGPNGPAFLMLRNFFVLKRYNNSDFYALAVGMLADRLAGGKGLVQSWPRPPGSLDIEEKFALQRRLKELGYYNGEIDGSIGKETKRAIRLVQRLHGKRQTGEADQDFLKLIAR